MIRKESERIGMGEKTEDDFSNYKAPMHCIQNRKKKNIEIKYIYMCVCGGDNDIIFDISRRILGEKYRIKRMA